MLLYHATFRAHLESIMQNGLGAAQPKNWDISEDDVVYLCDAAGVAESFCEAAEDTPLAVYDSGIVILAIEKEALNQTKLERDYNVRDNDKDVLYYTYRGIVPSTQISIYGGE